MSEALGCKHAGAADPLKNIGVFLGYGLLRLTDLIFQLQNTFPKWEPLSGDVRSGQEPSL